MRKEWSEFTLREQKIIIVGGIALGLILIYWLIWSPFMGNIQTLRTEVTDQKNLLSWMEKKVVDVQQLRRTQVKKAAKSNQSLMALLDRTLTTSKLNNFQPQLNQITSNQVTITFPTVSFQNLVLWLHGLWQKQAIQIKQLDVRRTETAGLVRAEIIITRDLKP